MSNDRNSSDDRPRTGNEGAANDERDPNAPRDEAPAAGKSKIEVVTPDRAPPTPPVRRPSRQIVQLGVRKPKSYLN